MGVIRMWMMRVWNSITRHRRDAELSEEMEAHLALSIEAKVAAGLSRDDARRAAMIESGGFDAAREAYRDQLRLPVAERTVRTFRHAARGLQRNPGFVLAVVVSLGLGVGANTALFSVIEALLLRPLPFHAPDELVTIGTRGTDGTSWRLMNLDIDAWTEQSQALVSLGAYSSGTEVISGPAGPESVESATVSPNLDEVLGFSPALGRWFTRDDARTGAEPRVVLSHSLWLRQFEGDPDVIGRTLRIYGEPATVIGVLASGTGLPMHAQLWRTRELNFVEVVARVRSNVSVEAVQRELTQLSPVVANLRRAGHETSVVVRPLRTHLYGSVSEPLRLLFGAATLLLLLGCVNVANLSLARTMERRRELAVRTALGASRASLAAVILAENLLLAIAASGAGLLLAYWTTRTLVGLGPETIARVEGVGANTITIAFLASVAIVIAFLVSIAPAVATVRADLRRALNQDAVHSGRGRIAQRVRRALVVTQLAIALLLVVGAGLHVRSMMRLTRIDLGFEPDGAVAATINLNSRTRYPDEPSRRRIFERIEERIRSEPGVEYVGFGPLPLIAGLGDGIREGFDIIGNVTGQRGQGPFWVKFVTPGYLEALRIPLRSGRPIEAGDQENAPPVVVINEEAARLLFNGDAVGRSIPNTNADLSRGRPLTVVGVVASVRQRDVTEPAAPEFFVPLAQQESANPRQGTIVVRTAGSSRELLPVVRRIVRDIDPELATTRLTTMDTIVDESLVQYRFLMQLTGAFSILAMVLAVVGLYAVVSYLVSQRQQEIGVRLAIGAQRRQIVSLVLSEGLWLVAGGILFGVPLAIALSRLAAGMLYEISPHDVQAFVAAPIALIVATVCAVIFPALRASRVDPVRTMRVE
jgi:putative ABC transport system permease protein